MFVPTYCGANARTRTSRRLSEFTIRQYHQCQNLECSESFTTLNTVERRVTKRSTSADPLPPGFIPGDAFPASHYGNSQLSLAV
ncbi:MULTISPECIES: Ogr/Delta-like zinc finger protein [Klebsiella]|uniref:ogr/Delta-like zinc finger family protein n=1 Tax=Klebsiella TaxID=570 RepID=UPI000907EAE4|nr:MULTISPECIES: ogr/Delta-like zinc finger family protein [Klebsiella]MCS5938916.1 ogr/Delta-like zinc finger family protein [Klebsiella variicola subsp. variicola]ELA2826962.1 ogr/Delta-like zinc finger family protein [Klebsiella variicola]EMA4734919.1 ogr/Delta-like zinc finger family protein [Klebsiella variicola]MBY5169088.1 ogr/Delta-like zinc finger family protein [Klebsiella variicola]MBZ6718396.1 ogr/Delta-like zinc finger family protein [Klebsiella variicola]